MSDDTTKGMTDAEREELGKIVRLVWVEAAKERHDGGVSVKPDHLYPWELLDEWNKEVDRRIGEAVARHAIWLARLSVAPAADVERMREALEDCQRLALRIINRNQGGYVGDGNDVKEIEAVARAALSRLSVAHAAASARHGIYTAPKTAFNIGAAIGGALRPGEAR